MADDPLNPGPECLATEQYAVAILDAAVAGDIPTVQRLAGAPPLGVNMFDVLQVWVGKALGALLAANGLTPEQMRGALVSPRFTDRDGRPMPDDHPGTWAGRMIAAIANEDADQCLALIDAAAATGRPTDPYLSAVLAWAVDAVRGEGVTLHREHTARTNPLAGRLLRLFTEETP